ncbi:MAG: hypothetical protein Q9227_008410 [Pyrenula ochraceoflavens]
MATLSLRGTNLTSFKGATPQVFVTAEDDDFDEDTLRAWQGEGFDVKYTPLGEGGSKYVKTLQSLGDSLGVGGSFAIVAFGETAAICLEHFRNGTPRLSALIAYYPTSLPDPKSTTYSPSMHVLVHLPFQPPTDQVSVNRNQAVLGLQGKRRTLTRRLSPGLGTGGTQSSFSFPCYTYPGTSPGFAEHDLDEYNSLADALAWTRSLSTVRAAFNTTAQATSSTERLWERNCEAKFRAPDAKALLPTIADLPGETSTLFTPTLTGGLGTADVSRFYRDFFLPSMSASEPSLDLRTKLLSRTISAGGDRLVDELFLSLTHSQPIPWLLPGIPPTHKPIELILISIVSVKAGKLVSERMYWDQASVLVQVGLLDPEEDVKQEWKEKGVRELPIFGREGAREVVVGGEGRNELIEEW